MAAEEEVMDPMYEEHYPQIVARYKQVVSDLYAVRDQLITGGFEPGLCSEQLSEPFNDFSLERFAQDVFGYVATKMKIPSEYIPRNVDQENVYIHGENTIADVCHHALYNVANIILDFFALFEEMKMEDKVESVESIVDTLNNIVKDCSSPGVLGTTRHFHTALTFVVCLAMYLLEASSFRGNYADVFWKLQTAWLVYFKANCLDDIERLGYFRILFKFLKKAVYDTSMVIEYLGRSARWKKDGGLLQFVKYLVVNKKSVLKENVQPPVDNCGSESEDDDEDLKKLSQYERMGFVPHEVLVKEVMKDEPKSPMKRSKKTAEAKSTTAAGPSKPSPTREELRKKCREKRKLNKDILLGKETKESMALKALDKPVPPPSEGAVLVVFGYLVLTKQLGILDEIMSSSIPTLQQE